jgi:hypothetical protein
MSSGQWQAGNRRKQHGNGKRSDRCVQRNDRWLRFGGTNYVGVASACVIRKKIASNLFCIQKALADQARQPWCEHLNSAGYALDLAVADLNANPHVNRGNQILISELVYYRATAV